MLEIAFTTETHIIVASIKTIPQLAFFDLLAWRAERVNRDKISVVLDSSVIPF